MAYENLDIENINEARRNAIKQSLRTADLQSLKALGETLFPTFDNPWREVYFQFLKDNSGSTFYRAKTNDGYEIIYCHAKENGMWFVSGGGTGPLQAKGLKTMKEMVEGVKGL